MIGVRCKKLYPLFILEVLKKHSNCEHPMKQKDILEWVEKEYGVKIERKSIRLNLEDLINAGFPVSADTVEHTDKQGNPYDTYTNIYYESDISDVEYRLLVDSVLFSQSIPAKDRDRLIENLSKQTSKYFTMPSITSCELETRDANMLFLTLEVVGEAIKNKKQIRCHYDRFESDKKLHHRTNPDGTPREYLLNPYDIVAKRGMYYLICNMDNRDSLAYYRLDRISDVEVLETPRKSMTRVEGLEHGLDLSRIMRGRNFMFTGKRVRAVFETSETLIGDVMDAFGSNAVSFVPKGDGIVTVTADVIDQDMKLWAIQYTPMVKVLKPESLAQEVCADLKAALDQYK